MSSGCFPDELKSAIISPHLDLSAAFFTVDHAIFIDRMRAYGMREIALKWFQSYLDRRSYKVLINNAFSSAHTLSCGVPQGSVLGARMYTIYVAPLANVINKHSINYHCYDLTLPGCHIMLA